ncbi:MAG: hypothetical protein COB96_01515, partial [Planctomycetota bacterium]
GYRSTNYRTVMAYSPGSVLPIYSNPDMLDPDGEALGTPALEDASRHIGEWYPNFVDYRGGVSWYHQITTTFASNNGSSGNMFDIKPKADVSLTGVAINSSIVAGSPVTVDVWWREGTWVGNDASSSGWTLLETLTGTSAGTDLATILDFDVYVGQDKVFEVDKTYGIFVDQGASCRYTNGAETYEDSFLRLESGCGKGSGGFGGGTFNDRIWNGTLYYDGAWGEHYLGTVMTGGGFAFNGNMFDIQAHEDIVISSFDVNVSTPVGLVAAVDVWYRVGTYVGHEDDPGDWTYLGTDTKAVSAGTGTYTTIAVSSPELSAGSTYGFYIRASQDILEYTTGSGSFGNSDMTIVTGNGTGGVNPFSSVVTPRTWNGRLRYRSSGDLPHMTLDDMVAGGTGEMRISNCTAGGKVHAAYSMNGGGPTSSAWGTVYMTPPWKAFPPSPFTADANGEVVLALSPPASMAGKTVWLQCLDWGSLTLSNGVATTIL